MALPLLLIDEINSKSVEPIIKELLACKSDKCVELYISSSGGDVDPGYALIDVMRSVPCHITTYALGGVYSIALDIFIAGDWRVVAPMAVAMAHTADYQSPLGRAAEYTARTKMIEVEEARANKLYMERTRYKTVKDLQHVLLKAQDVWMSAQEMVQHGIADEVARPHEKTRRRTKAARRSKPY